jgi:hypothetical protein
MTGDSPIVQEVRERARAISARYGDDIDRYCAHLRELEKQFADRLVSQITVVPARTNGHNGATPAQKLRP